MDKIMPYLEKLAIKLGVAVDHLWGVLVKQAQVEGLTNLIMSLVYIGVIAALCFITPRIYGFVSNKCKEIAEDRKINGTGYNGSHCVSSHREDMLNTSKLAVIIFPSIIIIILFFNIINHLPLGIKQTINPEYYALQEVLNVIK